MPAMAGYAVSWCRPVVLPALVAVCSGRWRTSCTTERGRWAGIEDKAGQKEEAPRTGEYGVVRKRVNSCDVAASGDWIVVLGLEQSDAVGH